MKTTRRSPIRFWQYAVVAVAAAAALFTLSAAAPGYSAEEQSIAVEKQTELRAKFLSIAEAYAAHRWRATEDNVFHGKDPNGIQVDTPDASFCDDGWHADGRENVGVPYSWGGFSTIESFDEYVKKGAWAGHAHTSGEARASRYTVGVDCSGFVSRCLDLPQKQTSLSFANLCYELESYDELLPGDLLNKLDGHVVLFKEFADDGRETVRYYEAGCWRVKETERSVKDMKFQGFVPMRYKPLDPRWVDIDYSKPTFARNGGAPGKWKPGAGGGRSSLKEIPVTLKHARPGEWARYDVKQTRTPRERTVTRGVARADGDGIALQISSLAGGKEMMTEKTYDPDVPALDMIMGFAAYDQDFEDVELAAWNMEEGVYETGGRTFDARRITAGVKCKLLLHGKHYPVSFSIEYVQSGEVPAEGMLEAVYDLEVTWADGRKMAAKRSFELKEFYVEKKRRSF